MMLQTFSSSTTAPRTGIWGVAFLSWAVGTVLLFTLAGLWSHSFRPKGRRWWGLVFAVWIVASFVIWLAQSV